MSELDKRIKELDEMVILLRSAPEYSDFVSLDRQLLIRLVEKHMDNLKMRYRGRVQTLLEAAARCFFYENKEHKEEFLRSYYFEPDERRYVEDVLAALKEVRPPDYLPRED